MKNIWKIFSNDWKNISTNWVALILIGGLTILPSLYAWFNIEASWDPYSQTDQLPVAIVNEDEGATVREKEIDVGNKLVENLKDEDSFDWQFTERDKAMDKLEYGDYYAVIVIPENFSERLGSVISDEPKKSEVEYYVNEKINAIAPKITEKGASVIVDQITSHFISEVNGTVAELFNDLGMELENDLPDIKRFEEYVFKLEENLPEIHDLISGAYSDSQRAASVINDVQDLIPQAEQTTSQGLSTIDETTAFINEAEQRLNELSPRVKEDLQKAQKTAEDVNGFLKDVQSVDLDLETVTEIKDRISNRTSQSLENLQAVEQLLQQVKEQQQNNEQNQEGNNGENNEGNSTVPQETIDQAIADVQAIEEALTTIQSDSSQIEQQITDKQKEINDTLTALEERSGETADQIDAFLTEYNENIEPKVLAEIGQAKQTLSNARSILSDIQSTIPEVESILNNTEGHIQEGQDILEYMLNEYPYVNEKVNQMADRIREIQGETDINEIIDLLKNDPGAEQNFFEEPVTLNKNALFPIENYGTGMTPFYTVLSLWVGALLLVSLLSTDPVGMAEYRSFEQYFGKLATFVSIGFLQTLVVTLGNVFLLNVNVSAVVPFVLFGLATSFVFMTIVFTLVSVLGDVGKAGAIVMLVLQIAGSGGTYPVALLPEFFQTIHPFLPFSYAVDLMREAVGGIVAARVQTDLTFLSIFAGVFLVIGIFLKGPLHKRTKQVKMKSRESGLFH
ncbi:YhgE/Pip domain-containing protein [Halobacillus karajensis]|uniref:Chromosome segregation protein n=1 Tax=Halobacillus karajensis TaxID=195088 RepID=A0A024P7X1_9BACI|nr:YhgE/Pip domain-containing protein [Halobacillus karajensis]CDQ20294.1 chromosome segregation protein [Halobacillus karajensis]CDQ25045.1 chromosome segregation protein [Halobacillus karajensis]CDQ28594.1 chromosome segregation protein [Halobacillus karajensis]